MSLGFVDRLVNLKLVITKSKTEGGRKGKQRTSREGRKKRPVSAQQEI